TQPADPDLPGAKATNAFGITWSHVQDPKSIPNSNLSINLNANTSNFYTASRITDSRLLQTQFNSGASFTRIFPGKPVSINLTFNHAQNLLNRTVSIRFPVLSVNMTRITPFKRKISSAKARWYENIGFIYALEAKSFVNTFDSLFFRKETFTRDLKYGINQTFRADLPLVLFRYFNFSPSFNYQERWFFKKEQRRWNPDTVVIINPQTQKSDTLFGRIQSDTTFGFYGVRDFNIAATFNTKLTGIFRFKNKWVKSLRHVLTPEIAFSYRPDFSAPRWRYYTTVQRDAAGNRLKYGHYDFLNDVFPIPAGGQVGQINFSLLNNFDLKTFSRTDTAKQEKILGILERFRISTGYNFLADSLHWQPVVFEGFSRISNNLSINFNIDFDPYARDSLNNRINTFYIEERGRPLRLNEARLALNASFQAKRRPQPPAPAPPRGFSDYVSLNPDDFYDFNIPWSFNTSLNLSLRKGTIRNPDTLLTTLALQLSGDFNLTPNWKFGINTGFDFRDKLPTLTNLTVLRNLHCWELSFNWTAFPVTVQQFVIELRVKSAVLQDLKLVRRRTFLQGGF
ncbi:MAG: putative LPS assembly protein LptD, partial [Chitinophagales bacterium]|nr:putative LPS assembly protein LptD [Chitinophagales bacterium]